MTERELIDYTLQKSGWGTLERLERDKWIDCQPDFETAHYLKGFNYPGGKFRFKPDWPNVPFRSNVHAGPIAAIRVRTPASKLAGRLAIARRVPCGLVLAAMHFRQSDVMRPGMLSPSVLLLRVLLRSGDRSRRPVDAGS